MKKTLAVICLVVVFAGSSLATTGNSSHGYGVKYKSLAGAGAALASMVYAPLKDVLGGALHALALKTCTPDEATPTNQQETP